MQGIQFGLMAMLTLLLSACSWGSVAGLMMPKRVGVPSPVEVSSSALQPGFRYLLVKEENGHEALMVWVGNEKSPHGESSVWVSSDGVVLRLAQGRLIGISSLSRNWRLVDEWPVFQENHSQETPLQRIQTSDEQPGFRLGTVLILTERHLATPPVSMSWVVGANDLRWVEQVDKSSGRQHALFAVDNQNQTIAGKRCIHPDWCLSWQAWPAQPNKRPL